MRAEDEGRVSEEEAQAALEAARIGGEVKPVTGDPAREPLAEAGEGEAEGFELAERELEETATHGDDSRDLPEDEEEER